MKLDMPPRPVKSNSRRQTQSQSAAAAGTQQQQSGVTVKDVGQAQSNGRMGERVRVQLRSSGVELLAVVRGPKLLEVKIK